MTTKQTIVLSLAAAALAAAAFLYFQGDETTVIRKRFETIMDSVEKPRGEGNLALVAKHQTLLNLLDRTVTIELQEPPISQSFSAEEIMSHYVTVRNLCSSLKLKAEGIEIRLQDATHATLTCYGTAAIQNTMGKSFEEARPAILAFVKRDGKWLLASAKEHKVFK